MNIFRFFLCISFIVLFFSAIPLHATLAAEPVDPAVQSIIDLGNEMKPEAEQSTAIQAPLTDLEVQFRMKQEEHHFILGICIVLLTAVVLLMELIILKRSHACTAENVVNGTGLVLIIQATVLVVLLSPTSEQLTAAIGVLGAIAGYLFGSARMASSRSAAQKHKEPKPPLDGATPTPTGRDNE